MDRKKQSKLQKQNIAIYVRVSTEHQLRPEGSMKNQEQSCRDKIKSSYPEGEYRIIVYRDEAISAKNVEDRPGMQKLISDIKAGDIQVVMITKLDRAFRSIQDTISFVNIVNEKGVVFRSLNDNDLDTSTAMGRAIIGIMATLAQMEREQTSERLRFANREKALRGIRAAGNVPYGYRLKPGGEIIEVSEEQKVVKKIFELYEKYGSFSRVRDEINGYKYKHTNRLKGGERKESSFIATTIRNVVRNRFYIGILEMNKSLLWKDQSTLPEHKRYYTMPGTWKGCIDNELFERCQAIADQNREIRHNSITTDEITPFIFSGLLFCECGHRMVGQRARKKKSEKKHGKGEQWVYNYYRCKHCDRKLTRSEDIETAIEKMVNSMLAKDSSILKDAYLDYETSMRKWEKWWQELIETGERECRDREKKKEKLIDAITKLKDQKLIDEINERLSEVSRQLDGSRAHLEKIRDERIRKVEYEYFSNLMKSQAKKGTGFSGMTAREKKIAVQHLFSRIVAGDEITATLNTGKDVNFQIVRNTTQAGQMGGR